MGVFIMGVNFQFFRFWLFAGTTTHCRNQATLHSLVEKECGELG
jgi:hypothetical protein